jgi:hypothetical protein
MRSIPGFSTLSLSSRKRDLVAIALMVQIGVNITEGKKS